MNLSGSGAAMDLLPILRSEAGTEEEETNEDIRGHENGDNAMVKLIMTINIC